MKVADQEKKKKKLSPIFSLNYLFIILETNPSPLKACPRPGLGLDGPRLGLDWAWTSINFLNKFLIKEFNFKIVNLFLKWEVRIIKMANKTLGQN